VVRTKPGRTPVDLPHLSICVTHLQPIADFVGPVDLQRHAGNDAAEEILTGKAENECDKTGPDDDAFELALGVITEAEHEKQRDQKQNERDEFAQKMRNRRLLAPPKVKIPDVTINQRDHQRGTQKYRGRAEVNAP